MNQEFLTFLKFKNNSDAEEIKLLLNENKIISLIVNDSIQYDVSYSTYKSVTDVLLKIEAKDFEKANFILDDYYNKQAELVDKSYYLFSYNNEELKEVLNNKDEWGHLNYAIAKYILESKNVEIKHKEVEIINEQKLIENAKPLKTNWLLIVVAYLALIVHFFYPFIIHLVMFSVTIGCLLLFSFKTLSNGKKAFYFNKESRVNGIIILIISIILFSINYYYWAFNKD